MTSLTPWLAAPVVMTPPAAQRFYFGPSIALVNGGLVVLDAYSDPYLGKNTLQANTYVAYSIDVFGNLSSLAGVTDTINAQHPKTVPATNLNYSIRPFNGSTTASDVALFFDKDLENGNVNYFVDVVDLSGVSPVVHSGPLINLTPVPKTLPDNNAVGFGSLQVGNTANNILLEVGDQLTAANLQGHYYLIGPTGHLDFSGTSFFFSDGMPHEFSVGRWNNTHYGQLVEVWNSTTHLADVQLSTINATTGALTVGWTAATELQSITEIRWQFIGPGSAGMLMMVDGSDAGGRGFFEYVVDDTSTVGGTGGTIMASAAVHYSGTVTQDARLVGSGLGDNHYVVDWVDGNGLTVQVIDEHLSVLQTYNIPEANGSSNAQPLGDGRIYVDYRVETPAGNPVSSIIKYTILDTRQSAQTFAGTSGNDVIAGTPFDDTFMPSAGNDKVNGGTGNDIYFIDDTGDTVTENANAGNDVVNASIDYTLPANVEAVVLQGSANLNAAGNAADNALIGNSGNNALDGKGGADYMVGGPGNDIYYVDAAGDAVVENPNEGNDIVYASFDYTLGANVDSVVLVEGAGNINAAGSNDVNALVGNSGNNALDGKGGDDYMVGGAGNDIYYVDAAGDAVVENPNEGNDIVYASFDYTLGPNVDSVVLIEGAGNINAAGSSLVNALVGNSGNNALDGKGGDDYMVGGAGNDVYYVESPGDTVVENPNEGTDIVHASIHYTLGANVESLVLDGTANLAGTGNSIGNAVVGNSGANTLDGRGGQDYLVGNGGNDTFRFQSGEASGDIIADFAGNAGSPGDSLVFSGFGTGGATFTQTGANTWQIHSGIDGHNETITLQNGASVDASDYLFV